MEYKNRAHINPIGKKGIAWEYIAAIIIAFALLIIILIFMEAIKEKIIEGLQALSSLFE